jgi:cytochrome c oxidase assembly protein subunit 15
MTVQSDYSEETRAAFKRIRTIAAIALGVAVVHVVFGAIVRISGSGMGCGDHWPKCYGSFFPPLNRPDLIIEISHRYLASIVGLLVLALAVTAISRRKVARVVRPKGPLVTAVGALVAVIVTAILGGVTVKMGNTTFATVAHWILALTLLALLVMTFVRSADRTEDARGVSDKTFRVAAVAAGLAGIVVIMGGVTAKYPGAPIACLSFPHCGTNPAVTESTPVYIQMTHRILAILLVLHLIGSYMGVRKRRAVEAADVLKAGRIAMMLGIVQILIAGAMIGMKMPPMLRSAHQAVGVAIWISTFAYAYMARAASRPVETVEVFPEQRRSGPRKTVARQSLSTRELE